jgi:hypothetical protein
MEGPSVLRALGLLVTSPFDAAAVHTALGDVSAPGWTATADGPRAYGWIQRHPQLWPSISSAILTSGWIDPAIPLHRDGGGWIVAGVEPGPPGAATRLDIRGELDDAIEASMAAALDRLDARLLRRWDPTGHSQRRTGRAAIPRDVRPRPPIRRS